MSVGAALLLAEELYYSVALQPYSLKGESPPFFNGPISALVRLAQQD